MTTANRLTLVPVSAALSLVLMGTGVALLGIPAVAIRWIVSL